jgi:hypothetical protein
LSIIESDKRGLEGSRERRHTQNFSGKQLTLRPHRLSSSNANSDSSAE